MGSVFGKNIKVSVFGESHGKAIGASIDGFPAGMRIDSDYLLSQMVRRKPKSANYSTKRKEEDLPVFLSGVLDGVTEGSPLCFMIENTDMRSGDYGDMPFRPSHADYTGFLRYKGFNDPRGGGHFSGRLTAPLVAAGTLCRQYLREKFGVEIYSHIKSIGDISDIAFDSVGGVCDYTKILSREIPVIDEEAESKMLALISHTAAKGDSVGGSIECMAVNLSAGLGSPMADGVESRLSSALFGVPAVKGIEFGKGFGFAGLFGSKANDALYTDGKKVLTYTNNNGGICGGITNGMPLCFTVCIKPTPSISIPQKTVDKNFEETELAVKGRHDPCIVPRAVPVIESVAAITLLDLYLEAKGYENA